MSTDKGVVYTDNEYSYGIMAYYLKGLVSMGGYFLYSYLILSGGSVSSTVRKLSCKLFLSSNTMMRYIIELEGKGLIEYKADGRNGVILSIKGKVTVSKIDTMDDFIVSKIETVNENSSKIPFIVSKIDTVNDFIVSKFDTVGENSSEKQFIVSKIDTVESSTVSKIDTVKRGIVSKFDTVNDEVYGISANNDVFCRPCSTNYRIFSVSKIETVKNFVYKEKEKKVIKEKDKEKEKETEKEKEKESTKEKEKEKEKEITKENYQKKEKEIVYAKNQKIHDSKQSTLLNNGTMAIHSTHPLTSSPNPQPSPNPLITSSPNPLSPSRAKLPVDTTNDVPPAKIAVSVDNQQDKEIENTQTSDNDDVMFDETIANPVNFIGKYDSGDVRGTKNGFDPQSGVSISKGKNVAQMAAKKSNGGIFGAVQFKQSLVDNGVDAQVAEDYLAVRRAKKGVFTKTALSLLLNEVKRSGVKINDALLLCIDRNWILYNHEWAKKLGYQYVNGAKLEDKFNNNSPDNPSKPKMIKNPNGTFTIRKQ